MSGEATTAISTYRRSSAGAEAGIERLVDEMVGSALGRERIINWGMFCPEIEAARFPLDPEETVWASGMQILMALILKIETQVEAAENEAEI